MCPLRVHCLTFTLIFQALLLLILPTINFFSKVDENTVLKCNFQFLKTGLKLLETYTALGKCLNRRTSFDWTLKHIHYNNAAALEILMPFWHWKSSLCHLCCCWALISCDFPYISLWGRWKKNKFLLVYRRLISQTGFTGII